MTTTTATTTTTRPWDAAEDNSLWLITGEYPGKRHSFQCCLAVMLPRYTHGTDAALFVFVGALAALNDPVESAWITHAEPLTLVRADDPRLRPPPVDGARQLLSDILEIVNRHEGRHAEQAMAEIHATLASFLDAAPAAPQPATAAEVPA